MLRRRTLAANAKIFLGLSAVAAPAAFYALTQHIELPFVITVIALAAGMLSLAQHQRGAFEKAAAVQVYAILTIGLVLALADPQMADFGLAVALLAPVHASLLARSPVKKRGWVMLVAVVAIAALRSVGLVAWPESYDSSMVVVGAAVFAAAAVMIALSANRLNAVFEVYEKAQINAYRHLIEHVQDAVMRFAPDGKVLFASRSAEKLFGCPRYELAGTGVLDRIHVLDRPTYLTAFAEANRDGQMRRIEIRMRRDDAAAEPQAPLFVWVEVSLSPVLDPDAPEERHEVVALLRDITERRDHENEMRLARRQAEEASSAKSRFLATIGHELRTPLNAIVGFSEMMTSGVAGELPAAQKEYAALIHQSGMHLIDVVRMLLDMSRIEAGKFELQTEGFLPDSLIEPCFKMVETMAREKNVRLTTDLPAVLPAVIADERACRQILINLLSNAIKFSHEESVVTVSIRRQGRNLNLSVTDEGIGMAPESIARIGEPFFQVHDGLTRRYEGTGLGLSIVKGLVDLHGGSLSAVSELGKGTTVTVLLPINGPAIKLEETAGVSRLRPDQPVIQHMPQWQDEKRKAL